MDISAVSNNSIDIASLINGASEISRKSKGYDPTTQTADYAKKGEPMYMADMDSDSDGTVTLDEFRDYCKSKNIKTRDMIKMSKLASAYRTMEAENQTIDYISKLIPNVFPKLKQADSDSGHIKQNENKYNLSTDADNDKKVSYKDYLEYCEQNAIPQALKSNAKTEETDNGKIKITHYGKAMNSYRNNNSSALKSTFEEVV